ncbi:hypothetical protein LINPERHAP2_LOCUS30434 [Linum perenne]
MLLDPVDQKSKQDREAESDDALLDELKPNPVVAASHFGPGFHRSLSTRVSKLESLEPCLNPGLGFEEADECSSVSVPFLPITPGKERRDGLDRIEACITTPAKRADSATQCKFTGDGLATPAKGIIDSSTPVCTATPALSTPKIRIMMSPDEKEESDALESANKLTKRTLKFDDTPVNDENVDSVTPVTAKAASLPKLFNTIDSLFRSGRSVMTKEEVIHKIIAAHLEFVNRGKSTVHTSFDETRSGFTNCLCCRRGGRAAKASGRSDPRMDLRTNGLQWRFDLQHQQDVEPGSHESSS